MAYLKAYFVQFLICLTTCLLCWHWASFLIYDRDHCNLGQSDFLFPFITSSRSCCMYRGCAGQVGVGFARQLCLAPDPKAYRWRGTNIRDTELSDCLRFYVSSKWRGPRSMKPGGGHVEYCSEAWNPLAALWEGLGEDSSVQIVSLLCMRRVVQLPAWMGLQRQGCRNWTASQTLQSHVFMVQSHYFSWLIFFPQIIVGGGINV